MAEEMKCGKQESMRIKGCMYVSWAVLCTS